MLELLFNKVAVATMDEKATVLHDRYVGVRDGRIAFLSDTPPEEQATRVINGQGKLLMPGLINAHTHIPMTPFRGWGDGHDLHTWLNDYIFPYEDKLDDRARAICSTLALAEMLASGTTLINDMYFFMDEAVPVIAASGINAVLTRGITAFDPDFRFDGSIQHEEMLRLLKNWHGYDDGRLTMDAAIQGEYTSGPWLWTPIADFTKEHGVGVHVHVSETKTEHDGSLERHGKTPAAILNDYGVFDCRATAAHCVWASEEDMDLFAAKKVSVAHCPVSNLKLGSGVANVTLMLEKGVNVALGTDGVSSNDGLDMLQDVKLAAILPRGVRRDPLAMSAATALSLATVNGAKAFGRKDIGRIQEGFFADMALIDLDQPHLYPRHDEMALLAYTATGADVCMTMVRGKVLYENNSWTTLDVEKAKAELESYVMPMAF